MPSGVGDIFVRLGVDFKSGFAAAEAGLKATTTRMAGMVAGLAAKSSAALKGIKPPSLSDQGGPQSGSFGGGSAALKGQKGILDALNSVANKAALAFGTLSATMLATGASANPTVFAVFKGAIEVLTATIGEIFLPAIRQATVWILVLAQYIHSLDPETRDQIVTWAKWAAVVAGVIMVGGKLISIVAGLFSVLGSLGSILGGVIRITVGAIGAMGTLGFVVAAVIAPVAIAAAAFGHLQERMAAVLAERERFDNGLIFKSDLKKSTVAKHLDTIADPAERKAAAEGWIANLEAKRAEVMAHEFGKSNIVRQSQTIADWANDKLGLGNDHTSQTLESMDRLDKEIRIARRYGEAATEGNMFHGLDDVKAMQKTGATWFKGFDLDKAKKKAESAVDELTKGTSSLAQPTSVSTAGITDTYRAIQAAQQLDPKEQLQAKTVGILGQINEGVAETNKLHREANSGATWK